MNTNILAFSVAILWGITPIIYKVFLQDVSYNLVICISGIVFFIVSLFYSFMNYDQISKEIYIHQNKIIYIVVIAFLALFLANILYYNAIKNSENVVITTTITALYPLITLILSYFILYESITINNVIGIVLILIGLIFLFIK